MPCFLALAEMRPCLERKVLARCVSVTQVKDPTSKSHTSGVDGVGKGARIIFSRFPMGGRRGEQGGGAEVPRMFPSTGS